MGEDTQERDIGRLEGKLDRIINEQCTAARDRRAFMQKLEEISNRNVQTDMKIEQLSKRIEAMEPIVGELNRWKERMVGVVMFVSCFAAALGAGAVYLFRWFRDAIAG